MEPVMRTVLILLIVLAATAGAETAPRWPLDLPTRYLTSNFMEHRPGRFHAGIDLKTDGVAGFPVRAVEDGWISRIRLSPFGYGQAIHLTGDSGLTYVYAHLERLADRWREPVAVEQRRRGGWSVSLFYPPDRQRVQRGEVLALSGQSGTTGPHLHFEVRAAGDEPLDPLAHGFAVADTIPPRILALRVLPAAPESRLAGDVVARRAVAPAGGGRELPPLSLSGPVAFTVSLQERSDAAGHRLEPWLLSATLDDSLVFEARNERFAFAEQIRMRLEWLETAAGRERWLLRRPGDDLPGRSGGSWSLEAAVLTPGEHRLCVRAEDRAGNAAEAVCLLHVAAAGGASTASPGWEASPVAVLRPDGVAVTPFLLRGPAGCEPLRGDPVVVTPDSLDAAEQARAWLEQGLNWAGWAARLDSPDWRLLVPYPLSMAGLAGGGRRLRAERTRGVASGRRAEHRVRDAAGGVAGARPLRPVRGRPVALPGTGTRGGSGGARPRCPLPGRHAPRLGDRADPVGGPGRRRGRGDPACRARYGLPALRAGSPAPAGAGGAARRPGARTAHPVDPGRRPRGPHRGASVRPAIGPLKP
jgi:hypothetical protein